MVGYPPVQLPNPAALRVPEVDSSWLGNLINSYNQGGQIAQQQAGRQFFGNPHNYMNPDGTANTTRMAQGLMSAGQYGPGAAMLTPGFGPVGTDMFGNQQYGFINKTAQTATPVASGTSATQGDNGELKPLDQMPADFQNNVKMAVSGDLDAKSYVRRPAYMSAIIAYGRQLDPEFSQTTWVERNKLAQSLTPGGKGFMDAQSVGQLGHHLQDLYEAGNALKNYSTSPDLHMGQRLANSGANYVMSAVRGAAGDPRLTAFENAKNAVIHELSKNWKGTGAASDADIDRWTSAISSAQSPEQLDAYIGEVEKLMQGRIDSYQSQLGRIPTNKRTFLSPGDQAIYTKLQQETGNLPGQPNPQAPPGQSQGTSPPPEAIAFLKAHPEAAAAFQQKYGIDPQQFLTGSAQ